MRPDLSAFKGLLFDLFHTLTSMEHINAPGVHTSKLLDVDPARWNHALMHESRARAVGEIKDPVKILKSVLAKIGEERDEDLIRQVVEARIKRFTYCVTNPPESIPKLLKSLKEAGFALALVSNADVTETIGWPDSPLSPWFDETIFSCDVGMAKPEPGIYELAVKRLGLIKDECLFIGDGGSDELPGARSAGIKSCHVAGLISKRDRIHIPERQKMADFYLENIEELADCL